MKFEGTYVAMVTPFTKDLEIDEEGFRSNINYLIDKGVNGLVGAGTTGESATVTHEEHKKIIDILVDEVDGRVEAVAGTGSNATSEALSLTKYADDAGAVNGAVNIVRFFIHRHCCNDDLPQPSPVRTCSNIPCSDDFSGYQNRKAIPKVFPQSAGKSGQDERKY